MTKGDIINFTDIKSFEQPFRFFCTSSILNSELALMLYKWFEQTNLWGLTEMEFYTQHEFSLLDGILPKNLSPLVSKKTIEKIGEVLSNQFSINSLKLVAITAHKLIEGHTIKIHNDFIGEEETHRLVIHVNQNWEPSNGGLLMLFKSFNSEDVSVIIKPYHNTAFGFEISNISYHAISTVYSFRRYSLVYTFKRK